MVDIFKFNNLIVIVDKFNRLLSWGIVVNKWFTSDKHDKHSFLILSGLVASNAYLRREDLMKRTKPNGKSIHTMAINLGFDDINVSLITDNAGIVKSDSHIHIVIFSDN